MSLALLAFIDFVTLLEVAAGGGPRGTDKDSRGIGFFMTPTLVAFSAIDKFRGVRQIYPAILPTPVTFVGRGMIELLEKNATKLCSNLTQR